MTVVIAHPRHPAKFHDDIVAAMDEVIHRLSPPWPRVLDPFAGVGKIHQLTECHTVGVELEPEWALQAPGATIIADAQHLPFPDESFDVIATSPCYGNRMADSFIDHKPEAQYTRNTYTHAIGRELSANNAGKLQWGLAYRLFHMRAWCEAVRVLKPGGYFLLNVKDHIRNGTRQRVAGFHVHALQLQGLHVIDVLPVSTPGLRQGENSQVRVDAELLVTMHKDDV